MQRTSEFIDVWSGKSQLQQPPPRRQNDDFPITRRRRTSKTTTLGYRRQSDLEMVAIKGVHACTRDLASGGGSPSYLSLSITISSYNSTRPSSRAASLSNIAASTVVTAPTDGCCSVNHTSSACSIDIATARGIPMRVSRVRARMPLANSTSSTARVCVRSRNVRAGGHSNQLHY
jgi:hypothetical protein